VTEQKPTARPTEPIRAVGYVRVSTAGQAERGMSLAAQRDRVTEYARANGYELRELVEEAASGGVRGDEVFSWEHRPVLLALLDRAQAREFERLIVAKLDRLSRDHATLVVLERRLQRHGVTVESVAEQNGDGPLAEFIRGQLALVAQLERSMILERVGAGKAKKKQLGRHVHGRVPYGYVANEPGVLTPNVPKDHAAWSTSPAAIVARIFNDVRAGDSPGRIARALNAAGVPSPQQRKRVELTQWLPKTVRLIVSNPAYMGERYGVKRAHPAIVSRRVFNEANAVLNERSAAWAERRATE
jgi:site-specific DNA recombinase